MSTYLFDRSRGVAYDNLTGDWPNHNGTCADGGAEANRSHYDRRCPNPAIGSDLNYLKVSFEGSSDQRTGKRQEGDVYAILNIFLIPGRADCRTKSGNQCNIPGEVVRHQKIHAILIGKVQDP